MPQTGATVIGVAADAVEQVVRPDTGQTVVNLGSSALGVAAEAIPYGKTIAPVTNEAIEVIKNSPLSTAV